MLEDLTSGTEKERQEFMASCVETLKKFKMSDLITPIFVFERLCNIIHPVSQLAITEQYALQYCLRLYHMTLCIYHFQEENDVGQFFLSLEKDPQQEEFLQGRMQGNPYHSTTAGLGPLMRDVKNKICTGQYVYMYLHVHVCVWELLCTCILWSY